MNSKPIPWTDEEEVLLREKFAVSSKKELLEIFPNRTYKSICGKAEKVKINKGLIHRWSNDDDEKLIHNYHNLKKGIVSELFPNRTWVSIQSRASTLGVRKYKKYKDKYEKWTDENLDAYAKSREFTFIRKFKDEKNGRFRVEVICEMGHRSTPPIGSFTKGNDCRKCTGYEKLTNKDIIPKIEERGYKLLSDYINSEAILILKCPRGHEWDTSWMSFNSGANCRECYQETIGDRCRLSYEYVKHVFESNNCVLVSEEYHSSDEKLKFICNQHKDKGVQRRSYNSFTHSDDGNFGCKFCGIERRAKNHMINYHVVVKELEERNFTLITTEEEYRGVSETIEFICNKHKEEGVQQKTFHILRGQEYGCSYCWNEKRSGENHYKWNGGISKISKHLRGKINDWKKDSMKNSNYTCELSGKKEELLIHHIYPFSNIVEETFSELGVDIKNNVGDYSKEELKIIEDKCLEIHYRYGLGACINREVHDLFHSIYTNFSFTPDDYEEFKVRYLNGEFK